MAAAEHEQRSASPLRRAMTTLDLSSSDIAELMGVERQAVEKWLLAGPPADRVAKIGALAEIADILSYRLRDGMAAVVVCQRPVGSAQWRPAELPSGGQQNCPLAARCSAHPFSWSVASPPFRRWLG